MNEIEEMSSIVYRENSDTYTSKVSTREEKSNKLIYNLFETGRITKEEYEVLNYKHVISMDDYNIIQKRLTYIEDCLKRSEFIPLTDTVILTVAAIMHNMESEEEQYLRVHDIIMILNEHYGRNYAENTREVIRKDGIKPLVKAGLVKDNGKAKTSPKYGYIRTELLESIVK